MKQTIRNISLLGMAAGLLFLTGCAGIETATQHSSLTLNTSESNALFLTPGSNQAKTLYVQIANTANASGDLGALLIPKLQAKGYTIVTDPAQATQILQVNLASMTRTVNQNNGEKGDQLAGGLLGGSAVAAGGGSGLGTVAGAGVGALGSSVVNGILQDVSYSLTTQLQILTRTPAGAGTMSAAVMPSGTGTTQPAAPAQTSSATQTSQAQAKYSYTQVWQTSQTNITTTADEVDLSLTKATPALLESVANSVASIF